MLLAALMARRPDLPGRFGRFMCRRNHRSVMRQVRGEEIFELVAGIVCIGFVEKICDPRRCRLGMIAQVMQLHCRRWTEMTIQCKTGFVHEMGSCTTLLCIEMNGGHGKKQSYRKKPCSHRETTPSEDGRILFLWKFLSVFTWPVFNVHFFDS